MEKQLTAMSILRERLQSKFYDIEFKGKKYTPSHAILLSVIQLIDTKLLATERQQLIDFGSECADRIFTPEELYNETFKTQ